MKPTTRRRLLIALVLGMSALAAAPFIGITVLYVGISNPSGPQRPLPAASIALSSPEGRARLERALQADHDALMKGFQTQEKGTWCGVASSVTVLNARGADLTQTGFFTAEVTAVRHWGSTTFFGMPLPQLGEMLEAHGADASVIHASGSDVDAFREAARRNLATPGDWLIVNYHRAAVEEVGGGHISPISAYDARSDSVLLLDTASYKYPPHWVGVPELFEAMRGVDSESDRSRGWVEVR